MSDDEILEEYFQICRRTYEDMLRNNSWPWDDPDSPKTENLVESEDKPKNL